MTIVDVSGRIVQRVSNISGNGYYFGSNLAQGNYVIRIEDENTASHFRIVKL